MGQAEEAIPPRRAEAESRAQGEPEMRLYLFVLYGVLYLLCVITFHLWLNRRKCFQLLASFFCPFQACLIPFLGA